MASRVEPWDGLDFFPTPPWATRALMEHVIGTPFLAGLPPRGSVWEPACGMGHMSDVLAEYFARVHASDVFDYGYGYSVGSFVGGSGPDIAHCPFEADWLIFNPPFNLALQFVLRARRLARCGVAVLVRSSWIEGQRRWRGLFRQFPPTVIAQFVERVPMTKGRWDPKASTATAYSWVVWRTDEGSSRSENLPRTTGVVSAPLMWIPPGQRKLLTRPTDADRFAVRTLATESEATLS